MTFYKAQLSAFIATACDFSLMILMIEAFDIGAVYAVFFASICGGAVNFLVNRQLVFQSQAGNVVCELIRYIMVSLGSASLNSLGVFLLLAYGDHYLLARGITAIIVAILFNYPLHKYFVFQAQ